MDLPTPMNPIPDTAVLLAGSMATFHGLALAPYPKIFLPLANRPLIHFQVGILAEAGVRRLILCVQSGMGEVVTTHLSELPGSLECLVRETSFGTGGSLKEVADLLHGNAFWVMNGDLLLGGNLGEMLTWHQERRALATVGSLPVLEAAWDKERVELDAENGVKAIHRIHHMQEKRSMHRPAGLYLFEPAILQLLPADSYFDLKEQLFPILYERGLPATPLGDPTILPHDFQSSTTIFLRQPGCSGSTGAIPGDQ